MGRRLVPERVLGQDVDALFAYRTTRVVSIRDRRLGMLNLLFLTLLVLYVLVWQILFQTGYLLIRKPVGSFRLSLRAPTSTLGCDPVFDAGCSIIPPSEANAPYCWSNTSQSYRTADGDVAPRLPCQAADDAGVLVGADLLITTRLALASQTRAANASWATSSSSDHFVGDVDAFTLLVDHGARDATREGLEGVAREMEGRLVVPSTALCVELEAEGRLVEWEGEDGCKVDAALDAADGHDVLTVRQWLAAGGVELDDVGGGNSARARGRVVVLEVFYTNVRPWFGAAKDVRYEYRVSELPASRFKVVEASESLEQQERLVTKRYGVKLQVLQDGELGAFDFNTLLLQLAAGSALLSVATLLMDAIVLKVLPESKAYEEAKVKTTEDFGDRRKRVTEEQLRRRQQQQQQQQHYHDQHGQQQQVELERAVAQA